MPSQFSSYLFSTYNNSRPLIIGLVAGETSGDILGAGLICSLKKRYPNSSFFGVAGPLMKNEGCQTWFDMEELAIMGITEVLKHLPRLLKIRRELTKRFKKLKPDVFIGIDAPDFNITLEGNLKQCGIKTIHYVSPSVWAWRQKRVLKIGKATNLVLVFLPFEKKIYDRFNVPCRFIGHTMADAMPLNPYPDKQVARQNLGIAPDALCLALLPGSRNTEVKMLSADFLKTALILLEKYPALEIIVPLVNAKLREQFERIKSKIAPNLKVYLLDGQVRHAMYASNAALLASGTAALECMLAKCPMVIGYRMNPVTFWLAERLVKIDYVSLPNLLARRKIFEELLQYNCQPRKLAAALLPLLKDDQSTKVLQKTLLELHKSICCGANEQAADAVLSLVIYSNI
ncbi:lipid-A-disaccharide synthase [Candidatus Profftia sp. (ex Adelges kitamiensis)]|uniref:lipid-A-disaccharide synthase n=1 Tax=Candidatus Profftia sp. (ex Adelges kitamiensis) TaxID=2864218 RepID=UPI001CE394F7|nr:lipid-A-disaccharide synthase [Candidatus Profftia sp. (ex Adelges kitamiensis)]